MSPDTLSPQVLRLLDRNNTWTGVQTFVGGGTGTGNVAAAAPLPANAVVLGAGTTAVAALASLGTSGQVLTSAGPGVPPAFAAASGGKWVQEVFTLTGVSHGPDATTIPLDNTIPQISEGTEHMTRAITPANSANKLKIVVTWVGSAGSAAAEIVVALFQDAGNDALAVGACHSEVGTGLQTITFTYAMTAGTTSATTFRVRAGANSGTVTFNGGAANYGGVLASSITITETQP